MDGKHHRHTGIKNLMTCRQRNDAGRQLSCPWDNKWQQVTLALSIAYSWDCINQTRIASLILAMHNTKCMLGLCTSVSLARMIGGYLQMSQGVFHFLLMQGGNTYISEQKNAKWKNQVSCRREICTSCMVYLCMSYLGYMFYEYMLSFSFLHNCYKEASHCQVLQVFYGKISCLQLCRHAIVLGIATQFECQNMKTSKECSSCFSNHSAKLHVS